MQQKVIGLIAGDRQFPFLVAKNVKKAGHKLVVITFPKLSNMAVKEFADNFEQIPFGKLDRMCQFFKENGVEEIMMAGHINKPKILDLRHFDARATKLLFRIVHRGDDTLLTALVQEFEQEGMQVISAHAYAPELLTPAGILTQGEIKESEIEDMLFGFEMVKEIGKFDVGQSIVVKEKVIIAVEAIEGTDATIKRGCLLAGKDCIIVKASKPNQEQRVDLPALGLRTLKVMKKYKAKCLMVEAGKSLFFDMEKTIAFAEKAGISIIGVDEELLKILKAKLDKS